ncbi:ALPHA-L-FUCOSIDASE 2 [Salix koriyanagi]|uniref:ALPHA-L-FUCOSIDASE 2 n=1 Tax=Salix koriyanagi TaxID=2511006 RepID=A0A9Q0TRK5_9ROSI|nr:ALPHA-L-FUCOSIDASE 2 [Salix koriyanagi]
MEDEEWVLVRRTTEKDWWSSSFMDDDDNGEDPRPLKITFSGPAEHWTDAIPIGNGRLGAMIWGGVAVETLQLNEDTLWTGTPGNYTNPLAPEALSVVRKLVDNGQFAEATTAAEKLSDKPSDVYQLLGDIKLEFDNSHLKYVEKSYHRELDLDTATTRVKYSVGDVEYTREYFASNPNQVIATKISGSKSGSVSFTVYLDSKMHHRSYVKGENQIIMEGSCPDKRIPPRLNANDNSKGILFTTILELQISKNTGVVHVLDGRKLKVEGSDWAILLLVSSSSFDGPFTKPIDSKKDPTSDSLSALKSINNLSYTELYAHHLDDYQSLFHRVSLQLSKSSKSVSGDGPLPMKKHMANNNDLFFKRSKDDTVSTAERVRSFKTDEDPSLVELLFQYGRYLLISCSRPGTQVANLQGIWNKDIEPPWDGAQHLNINLQMNYWPALPCNLKECQDPLFEYISSLSINGSKTAKVNYEAKGWVAHQVSDIWAKTSPDRGQAVWVLWPMGGAWLCTHLWEHYTYTMDKDFLKNKAYPLLEGCTLFLLDWLIEGRGGYLETNPSTSPEHMFIGPDGKPASVSYSSTMDMSIIKEVFSAIISAAEILGKNEDEIVQKARKAQTRLLPTRIARDGSIMEWAVDFEDPEIHHRHVSHLFGLFPGHTITVEKTPDLCKAADYTLYKRGEEGPGWSTTWKTALWARLHNSEHAYRMVKHLFDLVDPDHESNYEGGLYGNLFTSHPPFQIDANFGFSAAVAEMLVQSTVKDLYLLPALPRDKWANGCVKGLKARGGVTVNVCWKEGDLHEVGLWSNEHNSIKRLHYRGSIVNANLSPGRVYTFNRQLRCIKTNTLPSATSY